MSKIIDTARCVAVQFSAVKFLATETRKEGTALELTLVDKNGVMICKASMPMQVKKCLVDAGTDSKIVTDGTVRIPFKGLWETRGLVIQEGDSNKNTFRVYGDFDITGPSSVELLVRKDVVEFNPF
jgi:hypothetical protein